MSKAKNKLSKRSTSIPNKALYSRVSYLYQAAVYLATITTPQHLKNKEESKNYDYTEADPESRIETNKLDLDDTNLKLKTILLSKNTSKIAEVEVGVSNHVKQENILFEVRRNHGDEDKKENFFSQDPHDTSKAHNLHSSLRLATTTLNSSRKLVSELRSVSLKTQIRLSPQIKHSICKSCSTILIDGLTCSNLIENKSKGSKKPWADILIKRCHVCDSVKRFPISTQKQERREARKRKKIFNEETQNGSRI